MEEVVDEIVDRYNQKLLLPNRGTGLYVPEDVSFMNTSELTRVGKYFMKHGVYTKAPPDSLDFKEFWDEEERKLLHGVTLPGQLVNGKIKEVHISGSHYGFMNYALIQRVKNVYDDLKDLKDILKVTNSELKAADKFMGFPDFWDGHYQLETAKRYAKSIGLHLIGTKARRKGFSYFEGFDLALEVNMNPFVTCVAGAYQMDYLVGGRRIMNMAKGYLDHFEKHTDFNRGYLKWNIEEEVKLGFTPQGTNVEDGFQSILRPVTFKDTAEPGRGVDGKKLKFEECQSFPNLKQVIKAMLPTLESGAFITGQMVLWGTGGNPDKDTNWEPFMEIFYNPNEWKCLAFKDQWEDETIDEFSGSGNFFPYWKNLEPFIDKDGNTMKEMSLEYARIEDEYQKGVSKSINDYMGWKSERAMKPKEVFAESSSGYFPDVSDQQLRLEHDYAIKARLKNGWIREREVSGRQTLVFEEDKRCTPIKEYPIKGNVKDLTGCITLIQEPYRDANGRIPDNLYTAWNDPFGIDKDKKNLTIKNSLGVTFIYEKPNVFTPSRGGIIVGWYIGRPATMEEYDRNMFRLLAYFNAKVLFENDRGNVKNNAKAMGALHLLKKEPNINWDKNLAKKYGREFGISMNEDRKDAALPLFKEFLEKEITKSDTTGKVMYNYHRIYCGYLLDQIQKYSIKKNLDAISCMLVGMFDIEEERGIPVRVQTVSTNNDSFFNRGLYK